MSCISLMFHQIAEFSQASTDDDSNALKYIVNVKDFYDYMKYIYSFCGNRCMSVLDQNAGESRELVFLTFDDGYIGNYTFAADILDKFGLIGHFFIITSKIGQPGFMDEKQIISLRERGHIIGSHTHNHPAPMWTLDWGTMVDEWTRSIEILENILKEPITVGAVPGGFYSHRVAQAASQAGIRHLFNSEPNTGIRTKENCQIYGRYIIDSSTSSDNLADLIAGTGFTRTKQYLSWNLKKAVKLCLGDTYFKVRQYFISSKA